MDIIVNYNIIYSVVKALMNRHNVFFLTTIQTKYTQIFKYIYIILKLAQCNVPILFNLIYS